MPPRSKVIHRILHSGQDGDQDTCTPTSTTGRHHEMILPWWM